MLKIKIVSGLERPFLDEKIEDYASLERISALRGERLTLEILYTYTAEKDGIYNGFVVKERLTPTLSGELAKYARLHQIKSVPVSKACHFEHNDQGLLRTTPGLYPDLIIPMNSDGAVRPETACLEALLLDIEIPENDQSVVGKSDLSVSFLRPDAEKTPLATESIEIDVVNAIIPEQELAYTQWFHYDGLAHYYNVPMWSEKHWEIVENFARVAVKNGINMLLTPVFTPPLDTLKGGERLTTQLVGVERREGRYYFDYSLLDRFVDMCDRVGIKYLEISHLFTQGGALYAPKIMGYENGEYKRFFGWETDSLAPEYREFLTVFLRDFVNHMKERGDDGRITFHVSDEPAADHFERYKQVSEIVKEAVPGYRIMDAMSDFKFYSEGVLKNPVVSIGKLAPFLEARVENLWTYYCVQPLHAGHMIACPGYRTRSLGVQLYTHDICGFLHWGYNFYNNCDSIYPLNPYVDTSGEAWLPAGDAFSVYPAQDGGCLESLRLISFKSGIDDLRALRLCESLVGREETLRLIEDTLGYSVHYETYVRSTPEYLALREAINNKIKSAL